MSLPNALFAIVKPAKVAGNEVKGNSLGCIDPIHRSKTSLQVQLALGEESMLLQITAELSPQEILQSFRNGTFVFLLVCVVFRSQTVKSGLSGVLLENLFSFVLKKKEPTFYLEILKELCALKPQSSGEHPLPSKTRLTERISTGVCGRLRSEKKRSDFKSGSMEGLKT